MQVKLIDFGAAVLLEEGEMVISGGKVGTRATQDACPHRAPPTRCTAHPMHHVWHRCLTSPLAALAAQVGTWTYWAPEQADAALPYDQQVDMWSLGVLLYIMLSGRHQR